VAYEIDANDDIDDLLSSVSYNDQLDSWVDIGESKFPSTVVQKGGSTRRGTNASCNSLPPIVPLAWSFRIDENDRLDVTLGRDGGSCTKSSLVKKSGLDGESSEQSSLAMKSDLETGGSCCGWY